MQIAQLIRQNKRRVPKIQRLFSELLSTFSLNSGQNNREQSPQRNFGTDNIAWNEELSVLLLYVQ